MIFSEYIYQNGEKYGWIELSIKNVEYIINVRLFGVSVPAEIKKTDNYNLALHYFTILKNKYSK